MLIKKHLLYNSEESLLNFKKAEFNLSMLAQIDEDKEKQTSSSKNINIEHLRFLCNDKT